MQSLNICYYKYLKDDNISRHTKDAVKIFLHIKKYIQMTLIANKSLPKCRVFQKLVFLG